MIVVITMEVIMVVFIVNNYILYTAGMYMYIDHTRIP